MTPALSVRALTARYGRIEALRATDLTVGEGELVAVLGPNGAGKSTLLRAIVGLTPGSGTASFAGTPLPRGNPRACAERGVILVPEGRGIFGPMTVRENLDLGAYMLGGDRAEFARREERVFTLFPRLKDRQSQLAGSLPRLRTPRQRLDGLLKHGTLYLRLRYKSRAPKLASFADDATVDGTSRCQRRKRLSRNRGAPQIEVAGRKGVQGQDATTVDVVARQREREPERDAGVDAGSERALIGEADNLVGKVLHLLQRRLRCDRHGRHNPCRFGRLPDLSS